jgi:outer membrane protein OmpA-like peptidoglycan-associated protein
MDSRQLAELRLQSGYTFEDGTPFYEKLGEERAKALLKALLAHGYRIVSEQELTARRATSLTPSDDAAQRTSSLAARKPRRSGGATSQMGG